MNFAIAFAIVVFQSLGMIAFAQGLDTAEEEGLVLLGEWKPGAPTVVYVHGWAADRKPARFLNAKGWRDQGFNTLIFRWTEHAIDNGECRLFRFFPYTCPRGAESRIWNDVEAVGEKFVHQWRSFFSTHKSGEIRIVGHSLGTQLATLVAWEQWAGKPQTVVPDETIVPPVEARARELAAPLRIDLLDPYVTGPFLTGEGTLPPGSKVTLPSVPVHLPATSCRAQNARSIYCVMENALRHMQSRGVSVSVYGTNTAPVYAKDFLKLFHSVETNPEWLCPKSPTGQEADCKTGWRSEVGKAIGGAQHAMILPAYFWSIGDKGTGGEIGGMTAATATKDLRETPPLHFKKVNRGYCPVARLEDYLPIMGGAFSLGVNSAQDLTKYLEKDFGFNVEVINACLKEITFEGHVYERR